VFYSLWYNAPKLLPAGGLERGGTAYVFGVKDVARRATSFTPNKLEAYVYHSISSHPCLPEPS